MMDPTFLLAIFILLFSQFSSYHSTGIAETDLIHKNFVNLFDSMVRNNSNKTNEFTHQIRNQQIKDREDFEAFKKNLNKEKQPRFHRKELVLTKRDTTSDYYEKEMNKLRALLSGITDPVERENKLLRIAVDEREKYEICLGNLSYVKSKKDDSDKIIGAVAGRGAVESFYVKFVKKYLPVKKPGTKYSKSELEQAYIDFFNDDSNDFASALLRRLPGQNKNQLAETIRKIYGKLSYIDHALFNTLKNMNNFEQMIDYIQMIGASLSKNEINIIEKITEVLLEKDEFYTEPPENFATISDLRTV